jgi:hypothetical protein
MCCISRACMPHGLVDVALELRVVCTLFIRMAEQPKAESTDKKDTSGDKKDEQKNKLPAGEITAVPDDYKVCIIRWYPLAWRTSNSLFVWNPLHVVLGRRLLPFSRCMETPNQYVLLCSRRPFGSTISDLDNHSVSRHFDQLTPFWMQL